MTQKTTLGSRVGRWILIVLLACVVIGGATEAGLRYYISRQVAASTDGGKISFGAYPLIASLPSEKVRSATIDVPNTIKITPGASASAPPQIDGTPEAKILVHNLNLHDHAMVAEHIDLKTTLHDDFLLAQIQAGLARSAHDNPGLMSQLLKVSGVHTTDHGTIEVHFNDDLAVLTLRPKIVEGQLEFDVDKAQFLGMSLPDAVATAITGILRQGAEKQSGDFQFHEVQVHANALQVYLSGDNVDLKKLEDQAHAG